MKSSAREERLRSFFAGYFNQDWAVGATSWRNVVAAFLAENGKEQVRLLSEDLRSWLEDTSSDESQETLVGYGCDFDPRAEGMTDQEWVRGIVEEFERLLA